MRIPEEIDFPVVKEPLRVQLLDGSVIEDKKRAIIIRADSGRVFGVVSPKYKLLQHKDIWGTFVDTIGSLEREFDVTSLTCNIRVTEHGARMYLIVNVPMIKVEVEEGDLVECAVIFQNSLDGSSRVGMTLEGKRLVCKNGLKIPEKWMSIRKVHLGKIDQETLLKGALKLIYNFKDLEAIFKLMANVRTTKNDVLSAFEVCRKQQMFSKFFVENVMANVKREDPSIWDVYNGMTSVATHVLGRENYEVFRKVTDRAAVLARAWIETPPREWADEWRAKNKDQGLFLDADADFSVDSTIDADVVDFDS